MTTQITIEKDEAQYHVSAQHGDMNADFGSCGEEGLDETLKEAVATLYSFYRVEEADIEYVYI